MAKTAKLTANLQVTIGNLAITGGKSQTLTIAGDEAIGVQQAVGTSSEALVVGDVNTIGSLYIENTDAANFVEIDSASTFDKFPQKILAGGFVLLHPQTASLFVKANTASVNILVVATEL